MIIFVKVGVEIVISNRDIHLRNSNVDILAMKIISAKFHLVTYSPSTVDSSLKCRFSNPASLVISSGSGHNLL